MASRTNSFSWIPLRYLMKCYKVTREGNNMILLDVCREMINGKRTYVRTYNGIITPIGVLTADKDTITAEDRNECGFTNAVLGLCPLSWKEKAGTLWLDYLLTIIRSESPTSYLLRDRSMEIGREIGREIGPLRQRLVDSLPASFKELMDWFGTIEILTLNGQRIVTPMSDFQIAKAEELGIKHMEVLTCRQMLK